MRHPEELPEDLEELDELADEWEEDENGAAPQPSTRGLRPSSWLNCGRRWRRLREFHALARSIIKNSKGEVLLTALRRGFAAAAEAQKHQGAATLQQKAVIFTESRRTQEYLFRILEQTEFAGKVHALQRHEQRPQLQGDLPALAGTARRHRPHLRLAQRGHAGRLVEYFRDEAAILIATEAAAEGINLQFCNLVVNYDLPWNPQRIEQRIGRCHRYGQKFDVVVVNFLNKNNAADQRVYELLDEKFRLFNGVFGASDEVLGAVESGVDFEKRIAAIYQKCRTPEQIQFEFDQLQRELETEIAAGQRDAREKLLDNFDQEVVEKVRIQSHDFLDRFNEQLWRLTRYLLADYARFEETAIASCCIAILSQARPFIRARTAWARTWRTPTPTVWVIRWRSECWRKAKALAVQPGEVIFRYTGAVARTSPFLSLWWAGAAGSGVHSFHPERLGDGGSSGPCGLDRWWRELDECPVPPTLRPTRQARGAVALPASDNRRRWKMRLTRQMRELLDAISTQESAAGSIPRWTNSTAGPRIAAPRSRPNWTNWTRAIKETKKAARLAPNLPEKLERQRRVRQLETKRTTPGGRYDQASPRDRPAEGRAARRDQPTAAAENRNRTTLFTLRWQLA